MLFTESGLREEKQSEDVLARLARPSKVIMARCTGSTDDGNEKAERWINDGSKFGNCSQ